MTQNDLAQIDVLIRKNIQGFATKKDLASLESRLRKDIKNDIDDAVAHITSAITPFEERPEEAEGRLSIVNP